MHPREVVGAIRTRGTAEEIRKSVINDNALEFLRGAQKEMGGEREIKIKIADIARAIYIEEPGASRALARIFHLYRSKVSGGRAFLSRLFERHDPSPAR